MCVLWRVLSSFFEYPGYTLFTGYIGAIAPHEGTVRASVGRICLLLVPFWDGELSAHKIPRSLIVHRYRPACRPFSTSTWNLVGRCFPPIARVTRSATGEMKAAHPPISRPYLCTSVESRIEIVAAEHDLKCPRAVSPSAMAG
jgi:hypothetical protein